MNLEIDHVIVCVQDLEEAAATLWKQVGLASVPGGSHPGHGTANRIVPLRSAYLELLAVVNETEAEGSLFGRWAANHAQRSPFHADGVVLRTGDMEGVVRDRGLTPVAMSRFRPDGVELRWRLAGVDEMVGPEALPALIQWDVEPAQLPGRAPVAHRVEVDGVAVVALSGDPDRLSRWIAGCEGILIQDGLPGIGYATLPLGGEELRLPGPLAD